MDGDDELGLGDAGGEGGWLIFDTSGEGNGCGKRFLAIPALLTSKSMYPCSALTVSTMASRLARSVISPSSGMILSNFCSRKKKDQGSVENREV
jgi:hypothetical protein